MSQKTKSRKTISLPVDSVDLSFTDETVTFEDKTGAKSTWSSFEFPDGYNGAIIVTKLIKGKWKPVSDIKKITITFQ